MQKESSQEELSKEELFLKEMMAFLNPDKEAKKEQKGYPLEEQEILYNAGRGFYDSGQYEKGADLFTQLILSDPFETTYWKGLASCYQMLPNYPQALRAWSMVALLCETDAMPHFHAAECLVTMGEKTEALKALECAQLRIVQEDEQPLKAKIDLLKQVCA